MTRCATHRINYLLCTCMTLCGLCLCNHLHLSVQVGVPGILRYRCQVKCQESPQYARTASTTTKLVTANMLMSRLKTSFMGTATHAMATARVIVTAHATVAAHVTVKHRCLNRRKGCTGVAGRDSKLNWISLLGADTSTEES